VTPAAHYLMGGVATDLQGRTTLPALYAAGEVAGTGVHGANRLASNSLLEGLVFGARAAEAMIADQHGVPVAVPDPCRLAAASETDSPRAQLRQRAWAGLGVERDAQGIEQLLAYLETLRPLAERRPHDRASAEDRNLVAVTRAMAECALFREESRGGHFRRDFPKTDDTRFKRHTLIEAGRLRLADANVPLPERTRA
jgi:L-aspartate oxidase